MPAASGCPVVAAGLGCQAASCAVAAVPLGSLRHELVVQGYVAAAAAAAVAALAVICKYLQPQGVWCLLQGQGARQPAVLWLL